MAIVRVELRIVLRDTEEPPNLLEIEDNIAHAIKACSIDVTDVDITGIEQERAFGKDSM